MFVANIQVVAPTFISQLSAFQTEFLASVRTIKAHLLHFVKIVIATKHL